MASRNTGFGTALRYKGREGMWTWLLHRATGLGILLFLLVHVVDTAAVIYWPEFYDASLNLYRHPVFRVAEVGIFFAVLFHALNGLRIIIQDFWPRTMHRQRQLVYAVTALTALTILPVAYLMLRPLWGGPEPGEERHRERMQRQEAVQAGASAANSAEPTQVVLQEAER